jgi:integrase
VRHELTQSYVRGLAPGDARYIVWDRGTAGFGVVVHPSGIKTFVAQKTLPGRGAVRTTIGRFDPWTVDRARAEARRVLVEGDGGRDPRAGRATVETALGWHLERMRKRGSASAWMLDYEVRKYLADWLARPIAEVSRDEAIRAHERVTRDHGPTTANRVLREFRALWNTADRRVGLPGRNPVSATEDFFNPSGAPPKPLAWAELPEWRRKVETMPNEIRRSLQYFLLHTGLRKSDAAAVRWAEVDLDAGTLHRPNPKGGPSRAFTVPLSSAALAILRTRKAAADSEEWVFPTLNNAGEVVPVVQVREKDLPGPHRLRRTFATAAQEAGCDPLAIRLLLNHRPPADVTYRYVQPSLEWLRGEVEKVGAFLVARLRTGLVRVGRTG